VFAYGLAQYQLVPCTAAVFVENIASAIPAECLNVNGLWAVWPSVVLYGRSTRNHIEQDSAFMRA
jgi:hypothetical protein